MTTERPPHITPEDPRGAQAAAEILRRHADGEPEANIASAVRSFLIITGLVRDEEVVEEAPPAKGSRRAADLTALDTFVEFKRRIGPTAGGAPHPQYVEQLDDYRAREMAEAEKRALGEHIVEWAHRVSGRLDDLGDEERREVMRIILDGATIDRSNSVELTLAIPTEDVMSIAGQSFRPRST